MDYLFSALVGSAFGFLCSCFLAAMCRDLYQQNYKRIGKLVTIQVGVLCVGLLLDVLLFDLGSTTGGAYGYYLRGFISVYLIMLLVFAVILLPIWAYAWN